MRSYANVAAVRKELAPGGSSYNPGAVGYTSSFQEDFCSLGKTQRPSVRPGEAGYTFQEDPGFYREFAPGQQVVVYYPDPPPGVSPRHHVFWQPFTVVEMVGRVTVRVFNDLIDDFTKSDFKSFLEDFEIFKITLKNEDLI
jgi:hypothetical protein